MRSSSWLSRSYRAAHPFACALLVCAGAVVALHQTGVFAAQDLPGDQGRQSAPPASSHSVEDGRHAFAANCSFCHGPDAHGGANGGPDLTRIAIVTGDPSGQQLIAFLKVGKPPRMPAFNLPDAEVTNIAAFLHFQMKAAADSRSSDPKVILVGDAKSGEAFFNGDGKCTTCHSVTADLKGIGAKYDPLTLQGRMVLPRGQGGYPVPGIPTTSAPDVPRTATVTFPKGESVSGDIIDVSDYEITLRLGDGSIRTIARIGDVPRVVIKDPLSAHLDNLQRLTDKNVHDLTAYLVTMK